MDDKSILVSAITDVGYWRWWTEQLPDVFQIEFGGVQIYAPYDDGSKPPSSMIALRFRGIARVSFMRRTSDENRLPPDWPRLMQEDKLDSQCVSYDEFALNDDTLFSEVIAKAQSEIVHFNSGTTGTTRLAFWAGDAGLCIEADAMCPVLMTGETDMPTIASLHGAWWQYWRDYWSKRETPDALPKDYACEVTIPIKSDQ